MEIVEKIKKNKYVKGLSIVAISSLVSFVVGIFSSFLVPYALSVPEYAIYRTFSLYSTYIGIFHFGFIDGVYLLYAGKNINDLPKDKFRLYFRILLLGQLLIAAIAVSISSFFLKGETLIVFVLVAVAGVAANCSSFLSYIAKISTDFKNIASKTIVGTLTKLVGLGVLLFVWKTNYFRDYAVYLYISVAVILSEITVDLSYCLSYKSLIFGPSARFRSCSDEIITIFKKGIPLLLSNVSITIIYSLNNQLVSIFFDNSTFALYSFSYSVLSIITTIVSSVATLIFPMMRQMKEGALSSYFEKSLNALIFVNGFLISSYFVISILVDLLLPKYHASLPGLYLCMPIAVFYTLINVHLHSFYKTAGKNNTFFIISLIFLIIFIGAELLSYYLFRTTDAITISSLIVYVLWVETLIIFFAKKQKLHCLRECLLLIVVLLFYFSMSIIKNGRPIQFISLVFYLFLLFYIQKTSVPINSKSKRD